jgi:predicted dehydrogenase
MGRAVHAEFGVGDAAVVFLTLAGGVLATWWAERSEGLRTPILFGAAVVGSRWAALWAQEPGERLTALLAEATQDRPTGSARIRFLPRTTPSGKVYAFYDMQGYETRPRDS